MKNPHEIIRAPWITEKTTTDQDENGALCFKVAPDANKHDVKRAVEELFKLNVAAVRLVNVRGKSRRVGRYFGKRPNWKKAYVTIKDLPQGFEYFET